MKYTELLASYLPGVIVEELLESVRSSSEGEFPKRTEYESPVLFADLAGFTALSENMSTRFGSTVGSEKLAHKINSIFSQLCKIIGSEGGDVYKFAGDAMIVLWANTSNASKLGWEESESSETKVRRCVQSAKRVQELLANDDSLELSVKIGLGVGNLSILQLGGVLGRAETVSVGEPLHQAFQAEQHAKSGEIIMSANFYFIAEEFVKVRQVPRTTDKPFYYLESMHDALRKRNKFALKRDLDSITTAQELAIRRMIPAAAIESIDPLHPEFEQYSNEVRRVSVLFISLGLSGDELVAAAKDDEAVMRLHKALRIVQTTLYRLEGSLNKFLVDDKGCTIIAVFGLPPFSHENDPKRAVTFALNVIDSLEEEMGFSCSIGITTGTAFCGVIGSQTRKEYSILGDIVNLSARLMQASKKAGLGTVYVDEPTYQNSSRDIAFRSIGALSVKGKTKPIPTFQPVALYEDESCTTGQPSISAGTLNFASFQNTTKNGTSQFRERFDTISIIASKRIAQLQTTSTKGNGRNANSDALSLYFKNSTALERLRGSSSASGASPSSGDPLSPPASPRSKAAGKMAKGKANKAKKKGGFFGGGGKKQPKSSTEKKSRFSARLSSMLSSRSRDSNPRSSQSRGSPLPNASSSGAEDFEFGMHDVKESAMAPEASATPFELDSPEEANGSETAASDTSSSPNSAKSPRPSTKRESLILYNDNNMPHSKMLTSTNKETLQQAAVGAQGLYFVTSIRRERVDTAESLYAFACTSAQRAGMLHAGTSIQDLALLIQGTEYALPLRLFTNNAEAAELKKQGTLRGSGKLPAKYLESIVNEALANGEIRHELPLSGGADSPESVRGSNATSTSGASSSKFWGSKSSKSRHHGSEFDVEPYTDVSGNGGTTLKLVLVPQKDLRTIQSSGSYLMQSLMFRKIELLEHRRGSVTVMSGDPGSGKTFLLKRFVLGFLPGSVPVFCSSDKWSFRSAGRKFDWEMQEEENQQNQKSFRNTEENFAVWIEIINRWLDFELFGDISRTSRTKRTLTEEDMKMRMKLVKDVLDPALLPYISLLNTELGIKFLAPVGAAAQALSGNSKHDQHLNVNEMILSVVVDLICKIVTTLGSFMVVFDDCLRIDSESWKVAVKLADKVAKDELPLMLVFSSRPFEGFVDRSLGLSPSLVLPRTREALDQYRQLCLAKSVHYVRLGPLSGYMANDLFRKHVGKNIQFVSKELWEICEARCFNNPLLIKEFAFELRSARRPKLVKYTPINRKSSKKKGFDANTKYVVSLSVDVQALDEPAWTVHAAHKAAVSRQAAHVLNHDGKLDSSDPENGMDQAELDSNFTPDMYPPSEVPPPATAAGVLGARVDRLPPMEQLVLKIASVVGSIFSLRLLENVYPFHSEEARAEVKAACEALADEHCILHKVRASAYNDEYVYQFADELLIAAVRHRLLQKQKLSLASKITRARSQYKAALNLSDLQKQDNSLPIFLPSRISANERRLSIGQQSQTQSSSTTSSKLLKDGCLSMRKRKEETRMFSSEWKERYVVLNADSVKIFKKKDSKKNKDSDAQEVIFLTEASVRSLDFPDVRNTDKNTASNTGGRDPALVFVIESAEWERKGEMNYSPRLFTFAASSKEEAKSWLSRIRMVVNKIKLGALLPAPRGKIRSTRSATNSTKLALSTRLLPVRRRETTIRAKRDQSLLVVKIVSAKQVLSKSGVSESADLFFELYASVRLKLSKADQIVRKQTTLSLPESLQNITFGESFYFVLTPETLLDWSAIGACPERNAEVEIVLWRKVEGALGFDRMIGACSISLENLAKTFMKKAKGSTFSTKCDLPISWPYRRGRFSSSVANLQVSLKLVVCKKDLDAVKSVRTSIKASQSSPLDLASSREVGREVYRLNREMILSNERANYSKERANSATSLLDLDDDAKSISALEDESSTTVDHVASTPGSNIRSPSLQQFHQQQKSEKLRSSSAVEHESRERWASLSSTKLKRRSTPADASPAAGTSPIDAALNHLEFLMSTVANDKRKQGDLDNFKQLLLTRSFNSLVDHVKLDEDSKLWLSTFTRPAMESKPSKPAGRLSKLRNRASTLDNVESRSDEYLESVGRLLSYQDDSGNIRGPQSLSYFTNRLLKKQIRDDLPVFVHPPGDADDDDTAIESSDLIPLKAHLENLAALAMNATKAATLHKAKSVRRSKLAMALMEAVRTQPGLRSHAEAFPSCYQSKSMMTMSFAALEAVWTRWTLREMKQQGIDMHALDIGSWNFDISLVDNNLYGPMFSAMVCNLGLDEEFCIESKKVYHFVEAVNAAMTMHKNSYHNMNHAMDVAQAAYSLMGRMGGSDLLTQQEVLGVLIASICHDLEHPGLNNAYQVKAQTELALRYERCPLESHHVASCFAMLRQENCNLLENCTDSDIERVRLVIVDSILATDMQSHFGLVDQLRNLVSRSFDNFEGQEQEGDLEGTTGILGGGTTLDSNDRMTVIKALVHYADISNPSRTWDVSRRWQSLVVEEFFAQGDLERANGWEISPGMDREITKVPDMALSFIDFIVAPAAVSLAGLLPDSAEICLNLAENRARWAEIQEADALKREDFSEVDRKEALAQLTVRRAAFDEILTSAGFQRLKDGSINYNPSRSTKRRGSLYGLEALSARQSMST